MSGEDYKEKPSNGNLSQIGSSAENDQGTGNVVSPSQDRSFTPKDGNGVASGNASDPPSGREGCQEDSTAPAVKRLKNNSSQRAAGSQDGKMKDNDSQESDSSIGSEDGCGVSKIPHKSNAERPASPACDGHKQVEVKASTGETGAWQSGTDDKINVPDQPLESKHLFPLNKISELAKTNIFTKTGSERIKKPSTFLQTSFVETQKKTPVEIKDSLFTQTAKISYLEDDEWIQFGDGEVRVMDNRFLFIRNSFKTVLLNFEYKSTTFKEKDDFVFFEAKSRKSTGNNFEIVNRKYKIEFEHKGCIDEFLNLIN